MPDKKIPQEDDGRDIFDKALDAAPAAGLLLGGFLGRRMGRKAAAKSWVEAFGKDMNAARQNRMRADIAGAGQAGAVIGAPAGLVAGGLAHDVGKRYRKK